MLVQLNTPTVEFDFVQPLLTTRARSVRSEQLVEGNAQGIWEWIDATGAACKAHKPGAEIGKSNFSLFGDFQ
jgi:hypothetical protein